MESELEFISLKDLLQKGSGLVKKVWGGIQSIGSKVKEVLKVPSNVMKIVKKKLADLINARNKAIGVFNNLPIEIRIKFENKVKNLEKEYRKYVAGVNKDDRELSEELGVLPVAVVVLGAGVVVSLGFSLITLLKMGQFQTAINNISVIEKQYDKLTKEMLAELERYKSKNIQKYKEAKIKIQQKLGSVPKVSSVWDDLKGLMAIGILGFLGLEFFKTMRSSK
jgi:hypothetical protein